MPVQIDKLETSVEFTPPANKAATPRDPAMPMVPAGNAAALRDMFLDFLGDEFDTFSRMRGH